MSSSLHKILIEQAAAEQAEVAEVLAASAPSKSFKRLISTSGNRLAYIVSGLTDLEVASLEEDGFTVITNNGMSVVKTSVAMMEVAKSKKKGKKGKKPVTPNDPTSKANARKAAKQAARQSVIEKMTLNHLTGDKDFRNLHRLFKEKVETDDMTTFLMFLSQLDDLIGDHRLLVGVDEMPTFKESDMEDDEEDDEDEEDEDEDADDTDVDGVVKAAVVPNAGEPATDCEAAADVKAIIDGL